MFINFVSIDEPARWSQWHTGPTDSVYYSDFYKTKKEAKEFINQVKKDYPDSNLIDGKGGHKYHIRYVVLNYNEKDKEGFETLCRMMRAYSSYNEEMKKKGNNKDV